MNKRRFLQAGGTFVGMAALLRLATQSKSAAPSQSQAAGPLDTASRPEAELVKANPYEVTKSEAKWREQLPPEAFAVLRKAGTERPHSSPLDKLFTAGTYSCAGCSNPVFSSEAKFDSGTGWPSFYAPLDNAVATTADRAFFMTRTEVHCDRCGGHLGHVFDDGPKPTGKRYCMNGVAMSFQAA